MYDSIAKASSDKDVKAQMDLFSGRINLALGQTTQAYQFFLDAVNNYPSSPDSYSMLVALVNNSVPVDDLSRGQTIITPASMDCHDALQRYISANPKMTVRHPTSMQCLYSSLGITKQG